MTNATDFMSLKTSYDDSENTLNITTNIHAITGLKVTNEFADDVLVGKSLDKNPILCALIRDGIMKDITILTETLSKLTDAELLGFVKTSLSNTMFDGVVYDTIMDEHASHITIQEYMDWVENGLITSWDGDGHLATATHYASEDYVSTGEGYEPPKSATHVAWFNR